jgi:hypothetical protein
MSRARHILSTLLIVVGVAYAQKSANLTMKAWASDDTRESA